MFEASLLEAGLLKKLMDSIKDLIIEATLDCTGTGVYLQAMDSSHVALVSFALNSNAFEHYRCDRNISLGINMSSMSKILKCSLNDDKVMLKAQDKTDTLTFNFESVKKEKVSEFEMKLMNLEIEHLGIPDTEYFCVIKMPSAEFSKICRDLSLLGDSVTIKCTKNGVNFITSGDLGDGRIKLKQSSNYENEDEAIIVEMRQPVSLAFSLRYLIYFTKAAPLSNQVSLSMSEDVPISEFISDSFDLELFNFIK